MITTVSKGYTFSAAHWIPTLPEEHKCRRLHGHTYHVTIEVGGYDPSTGFCVEFTQLDELVGEVLAPLDHQTLNNVVALDVPTVEVLSRYIFGALSERLAIVAVTVREGEGGAATTITPASGVDWREGR